MVLIFFWNLLRFPCSSSIFLRASCMLQKNRYSIYEIQDFLSLCLCVCLSLSLITNMLLGYVYFSLFYFFILITILLIFNKWNEWASFHIYLSLFCLCLFCAMISYSDLIDIYSQFILFQSLCDTFISYSDFIWSKFTPKLLILLSF